MQNKSDLLDTDLLPIRTAEGIPPAVCEAAPTGGPVIICLLHASVPQTFSS